MSAPTGVSVTRAGLADAVEVSALYADYCAFYRSDVDRADAAAFIRERLERGESIVLIARDAGTGGALGFVQVYPKFSSTRLRKDWLLNDLFVAPDARRRGVGRALMRAAVECVEREGGGTSRNITLKTEVTNHAARSLYESLGWTADEAFVTYNHPLGDAGGAEE